MTILVLLIALIFAVGVTPLVRQLALRINFVAIPRTDRAHQETTPLMGGLAMYIGLTGSILLLSLIANVFPSSIIEDTAWPLSELYIVMLSGTILALIGLLDDWKRLPPKLKLALEIPPVLILPLMTSIKIQLSVPHFINFGLTVCWFIYMINAFNYLDNMDGVAATTSTVAGMFFTVIAVINEQFLVAALAAAIAGVSFGFLHYNLFEYKRKIFMGDVGSLFLGFLLAVIGVKLVFKAESPWITWPVPVLVLGVPVFDTALVFISRLRRGQSFLKGGTDHLSHRLARLNFGHYGVPFAIGLIGSALGSGAILVMHSSFINSLAVQIVVGIVALYMMIKLEFTVPYEFITGKPAPDSADGNQVQKDKSIETPHSPRVADDEVDPSLALDD